MTQFFIFWYHPEQKRYMNQRPRSEIMWKRMTDKLCAARTIHPRPSSYSSQPLYCPPGGALGFPSPSCFGPYYGIAATRSLYGEHEVYLPLRDLGSQQVYNLPASLLENVINFPSRNSNRNPTAQAHHSDSTAVSTLYGYRDHSPCYGCHHAGADRNTIHHPAADVSILLCFG